VAVAKKFSENAKAGQHLVGGDGSNSGTTQDGATAMGSGNLMVAWL
jgi:hypothetical protein